MNCGASAIVPLHELRLRTALWDLYQGQGKYAEAFKQLCEGGTVERGIDELQKVIASPQEFMDKHFPNGSSNKAEYKYWRQCVMGALAFAFSKFQAQESTHEARFQKIEAFLDNCLPTQYESNGVRSRLHFFRGIAHEANYQLELAAPEYELAVNRFIKRAEKELANPQ